MAVLVAMRVIEKIIRVEKRHNGYVTYAIAGGDEVSGFSLVESEYKVGDKVMVGFDDKWHTAKMWKELPNKTVDMT